LQSVFIGVNRAISAPSITTSIHTKLEIWQQCILYKK
jgi:hypothetical protein